MQHKYLELEAELSMENQAENNDVDVYAIVEIFGHQRIAGKISEHNLGGTFVRVDVPSVNGRTAFTKLYGPSAIYAISFVDRDVCLAAAERLAEVPVNQYTLADVTKEAVRNRLEHSNFD